MFRPMALAAILALTVAAAPGDARANDRHAGYYYPEPETIETYTARAQTLPEASRDIRLNFVTNLVESILNRPHAPVFDVFVKGEFGQKLIITGTEGDRLSTVYRARGLLATMTSITRRLPLIREMGVEDIFTFLDLLKLMGFEQVTVTDGLAFAHQIRIE